MLAGLTAAAQQPEASEPAPAAPQANEYVSNFQFSLGGGLHSLLYSPTDGEWQPAFGGLFEIQYQYSFNHSLGIAVGLQAGCINGQAEYSYLFHTGITDDAEMLINENSYTLTTRLDNWRERQHIMLLTLPVELTFRKPINAKNTLQMGIGAAFSLPLSASCAAAGGSRTVSAYVPATGVTYGSPNQPLENHGFATYGAEGDADISCARFAVGVVADLGWAVSLQPSMGLYLGLYGSYLPGSLVTNDGTERDLLQYPANSALDPAYNGSMNSDRVTGGVHGLEAGVKVGLRLGAGITADRRAIKAARKAASR